MSWTDERVALLKKLWGEGKTAAEIASALGGITRNAVIGKAHRLKLSNRLSPIQPATKKTVKQAANTSTPPAEKKVPKAKPAIQAPVGKGLSMAELTARQCRWPEGDPKEAGFGFCGHTIATGLPYCEEHARMAYQAASRNRILKAEDFEERARAASPEDEHDIKTAVGK
ncbi:MAG: GcrA family cell cycle regulator [Alphaproteobacteria bacterium]|nr:GcrA family cell cycle regulator [Alphaproteobacteria bacterium]MCD8526198.1 GcrA family cell cycle regulator [Alphaproteobacteria bacterium]MCD8570152.1 GcrA family cell cycle regulator [Alphaproteobacteria bacterium]